MALRTECDYGGANWDCGMIIPGFYVGSLRSALDTNNLVNNTISHILTAAGRLSVEHSDCIEYMQIDIADHPSENLFRDMQRAVAFLDRVLVDRQDDSTKATLVHCASGISRSVSLCCAWLMIRKQMSFVDAIALVQVNRPRANPNIGFRVQLRILEEAKGDINIASQIYSERIGDSQIMNMIFEQRDTANKLHRRIEDLENVIQQQQRESASEISLWERELLEIQTLLDQNASMHAAMSDGPAKMIRKSASQKTALLLGQLAALKHHP
jgi:protein-tyrosine phosphatase